MPANNRRVRWLSAGSSQQYRAYSINRPPVFTSRCCRLVVADRLGQRQRGTRPSSPPLPSPAAVRQGPAAPAPGATPMPRGNLTGARAATASPLGADSRAAAYPRAHRVHACEPWRAPTLIRTFAERLSFPPLALAASFQIQAIIAYLRWRKEYLRGHVGRAALSAPEA